MDASPAGFDSARSRRLGKHGKNIGRNPAQRGKRLKPSSDTRGGHRTSDLASLDATNTVKCRRHIEADRRNGNSETVLATDRSPAFYPDSLMGRSH